MSKKIILVHLFTVTIIIFTTLHTYAQEFCPANQNINCQTEDENQNDIILTWPTTQSGAIAFSRPFCLDERKNSIIRTCCNGLWGQTAQRGVLSPQCAFYAYEFNKKCPQNYTEVYVNRDKVMCVMISTFSEWKESCVDSGTQISYLDLVLEEKMRVNNYLLEKGITEAWLPAKRLGPFEPVVWKLLGWMWNKPIEFEDYLIDFLPGAFHKEECMKLILRNGTSVITLDDCSRVLPNLCVFDHTRTIIDTGSCVSTRYKGKSQDKCYGISNIPDNVTAMEDPLTINAGEVFIANSVEKLIIYEQLAQKFRVNRDQKCLAHFSNGSTLYDSLNRWTVLDLTGKWELSPHFNCIATETARKTQNPQLFLKFNPVQGKLVLVIYSSENLWREDNRTAGVKCYTNADYELVKVIKVKRKLWSGVYRFGFGNYVKEINKDIYDIKLYGDGPGYYWCEGHSIPDYKLIQTGKVYATRKTKGLTYAISLFVKLGIPLNIEMNKKVLKNLAREYKEHIKITHEISAHNLRSLAHRITSVRPMKIESYDPVNLVAKFIFHVTVTTNLTEIELIEGSFGPTAVNVDPIVQTESDPEIPQHVKEYYEIKSQLNTLLLQANSLKFTYVSLNSTEYCLPTLDSVNEKYHWVSAHIGERTLSRELCLQPNGLPLARKCLGDFIYGGTWDDIDFSQLECVSNITDITKTLYEIEKSPISLEAAQVTMGAMSEMTENATTVIPSDVYFLGKTIQTMSKLSNGSTTSLDTVSYYNNLANILNNIMAVNETIVEKSASNLNATNILLDSFDNLINQFSEVVHGNLLDNEVMTNNHDDGTMLLLTPRLMVFIADPSVSGISGVGLVRRNLSEPEPTNFTEYEIIKIHSNASIDGLFSIEGLELATYAPQELLTRVDEIEYAIDQTRNITEIDPIVKTTQETPPLRVVITIYFNDRLFVQGIKKTSKSASKVVSVSLPGHGTDLPVLFPTIFRQSNDSNTEPVNFEGKCGYWDYQSYEKDGQGRWSTEGCEYLGKSSTDDQLIACGCTHLTHFAYLVMGTQFISTDSEEHRIIEEKHAEALDIITFIGCSLSLLGILGIAITAIAFKSWREKPGTKVLLHLSAAIALEMILIAYVNTESLTKRLILEDATLNCVLLGATMHYSILVVFSWMLITAFLQFMRYVKVLGETRPPRFLLKSSLIGWVIPLIPVLIIAGVSPMSYVPPSEALVPGICYPKGNALYFGLLAPIAVIVIGNLVVFIIVIYNIFRIPEIHIRTNERDLLVSQLRLSINLFFLLGLSWIFGLATVSKAGIIFSYLFCLTATLQGFVLFIYFIIMDPMTRKFWQNVLANLGFNNCVEKPKEFE